MINLTDIHGGRATPILFEVGQVIRHKAYRYRGVIVSYDTFCCADDTWYYSNPTQPAREQPWYHVLVHDSGGLSTYVAQSNLELEEDPAEVNHPRIGCYFAEFRDGAYRPHAGGSGPCSI